MVDWSAIISKYYGEGTSELKTILLKHSQSVARKALQIGALHPELELNMAFVEEAAMLHDIGIIRCNAPGIQCFGTKPYLMHGRIGAEMLRKEGLPRHARVCERHTGAGLPGLLPETLEEKVVCYADKFFSKTRLEEQKTIVQVEQSLSKFGMDGVERFCMWVQMFE